MTHASLLVDQATWARLLKRSLTQLGCAMPPLIAEAENEAEELASRLAFPAVPVTEIAAAITAAQDAGRDPLTDKTVSRLLAARALNTCGLDSIAAHTAQERVARAFVESAAELMGALADVVEPADTALHEAFSFFGDDIDLDDPRASHDVGISRGAQAASLYARAVEARARVDAVREAWASSCTPLLRQPETPKDAPLAYFLDGAAAVDLPTDAGPWKAVTRGLHLTPPRTPQQWHERLATIEDERDQRRRARAAEAQARLDRMRL